MYIYIASRLYLLLYTVICYNLIINTLLSKYNLFDNLAGIVRHYNGGLLRYIL